MFEMHDLVGLLLTTRNTLDCDQSITPHTLFSPMDLLNLVQLEIAQFDPPTPKTTP